VIGFAATVAAIVLAGRRVTRTFRDAEPMERFTAAAITGVVMWLAASWILALSHALTRRNLIIVAVLFAALGAAARHVSIPTFTARDLRHAALLIPVAIFTCFALFKGAILPPLNHDALAYHLPRAVMMMRAHGFERFNVPDIRMTSLPANYELLLADMLIMSGSDRLTEWIGTVGFILLLCESAALAQRWWHDDAQPELVAIAVAATPVLILHAAADKNDLMATCFAVAALMWGARWAAHGGTAPMLLLILSLAAGIGTKPTVALIAAGLAPFLLRRAIVSPPRASAVAAAAALSAVAFALCGGVTYIANLLSGKAPAGVQIGLQQSPVAGAFAYGDWSSLWEFPFLLLTIPFTPNSEAAWLPWRHQYWFWPHYELFSSHFGALFTIFVIALPFAVIRFRGGERRERSIAMIAAAVAAVVMLPVAFRPLGAFMALPRYLLFVVPVVVCGTLPPFVSALQRRHPAAVPALIMAIVVMFAASAVENTIQDRFAPLAYVRWILLHPGNRSIPFMPNRAASVVDRLAAPHDTIAIDASFETWSYPAYGATLTRNVLFLPPDASPAGIPAAAQWVIVDRSWNAVWGNPKMTDMGKFWRYVGRGAPSADDVRLRDALLTDPQWQVIFYDRVRNQAVFRRAPR